MVDLITMKSEIYKDDTGREIEIGEIPDNLKADAEKWRANLVENIAEHDEEVMMKYLDGEELTEEEIRKTIRKATISLAINPVLCGASYKNKGVQPLLDAINDFMPSPLDVPTIKGIIPGNEEVVERKSSDDEPFAALAFKIVSDPYVGKLAYFRVYSGVLESGSYVYNSTKGKTMEIGRASCRERV